jgi:hypothetical protein
MCFNLGCKTNKSREINKPANHQALILETVFLAQITNHKSQITNHKRQIAKIKSQMTNHKINQGII